MKALIDTDIIVYRCAWASQDVEPEVAKWRMDELVHQIQEATEATEVRHYLSADDKSNFRYALYPEYKANRKQEKPIHYLHLREVVLKEYGCYEIFGQEADDALGIAATASPADSVICSIDKDLDQIPGHHYNFVTKRLYKVSPIEASRSFFDQILVGDKSTDNIEGCPKIGKVTANRMLEGCQNENEMMEQVVLAYSKAYPEKEWADRLFLAGNLLWIRKQPNQPWTFEGEAVSKQSLESFLETVG